MKRAQRRLVYGLILLTAATVIPAAAQPVAEERPFAYRIRVVRDGAPAAATAVLVRRQSVRVDVISRRPR